MTREEIDRKYQELARALEEEFFVIANPGTPRQFRVLKPDKDIGDFNQRHAEIWRQHEQELIAAGLMRPPVVRKPGRNIYQELDELKTLVAELSAKLDSLQAK